MDPMSLSNQDWLDISRELEDYHSLFYQCWQMGRPTFVEGLGTACVVFNKDGDFLDFQFDPEFWNKLTNYERLFVISHECLHVCLEHGLRTKDATKNNKEPINYCIDVVVNHLLVNSFGFERDKISIPKLCWVDTVFEDHPKLNNIPENESYEFYYNLIPTIDISSLDLSTLDDHGPLCNGFENVIDKMNEVLSDEEKESLKPLIEKHFKEDDAKKTAGSVSGSWTFLKVKKVPPKKKWETIIQSWTRKYMKEVHEENEQWARLHRRLQMLDSNLLLPSEMEEEYFEPDKLPVFLFIDTSGSCWGMKDRFIQLAMSIPTDKFIVRAFTFDTKTEEVDLITGQAKGQARIYGGGGTSFAILEETIQKEVKEGLDYPQGVFVITDGYGNKVLPEYPERWHWLMTPYNSRSYIDSRSKIYELSQFE